MRRGENAFHVRKRSAVINLAAGLEVQDERGSSVGVEG